MTQEPSNKLNQERHDKLNRDAEIVAAIQEPSSTDQGSRSALHNEAEQLVRCDMCGSAPRLSIPERRTQEYGSLGYKSL